MSCRLHISCTEEEKKNIKIFAARQNKSISQALLDCFREKMVCEYGYSHVPNSETLDSIQKSGAGCGIASHASLEDLFKEC